jgi:GNAT superfamily N-acetyltransferase
MAIPARMRDRTREITKVHCEPEAQNQGHATALLHEVCREADRHGITLVLWPRPYGDDIALSQAQLIEWYGRAFGFAQIQAEPPLMARMPWSTPQYLKPVPSAVACYG